MKLRNNNNYDNCCKGKRISELDEKVNLLGTEYVPYLEGEDNGKISLDSLKDYLFSLIEEYLVNEGIIRQDWVLSEPAYKLLATLPELIADRACKDEYGNNINDTYLTRSAVKEYIGSIYEDLFTENPPKIMDGYITVDMLSDAVLQLLNSGGAITNFPDDEDLTVKDGKLKFKDKAYDPNNYSGLGRIILRKNMVDGVNVLTQQMISEPNVIYVILYDYDLRGEDITIPYNSTIEFHGGSFINCGTIYLDRWASIIGNKCNIYTGTKTLFVLGKDTSIKSLTITDRNLVTIFRIESQYLGKTFTDHETSDDVIEGIGKFNTTANIHIDDILIRCTTEEKKDTNCIELISNGLGYSYWDVHISNVFQYGYYNSCIHVNAGQAEGATADPWLTDCVFNNIKTFGANNFTIIENGPGELVYYNCSMQFHKSLTGYFADINGATRIVFDKCHPWDFTTNNGKLTPYKINASNSSGIYIDGITSYYQNVIEMIGETPDGNYPVLSFDYNSNNAGSYLITNLIKSFDGKATVKDLFNLPIGTYSINNSSAAKWLGIDDNNIHISVSGSLTMFKNNRIYRTLLYFPDNNNAYNFRYLYYSIINFNKPDDNITWKQIGFVVPVANTVEEANVQENNINNEFIVYYIAGVPYYFRKQGNEIVQYKLDGNIVTDNSGGDDKYETFKDKVTFAHDNDRNFYKTDTNIIHHYFGSFVRDMLPYIKEDIPFVLDNPEYISGMPAGSIHFDNVNKVLLYNKGNKLLKMDGTINKKHYGSEDETPELTGDGECIGFIYLNKDNGSVKIWVGSKWYDFNGNIYALNKGNEADMPTTNISVSHGYFNYGNLRKLYWSGNRYVDSNGRTYAALSGNTASRPTSLNNATDIGYCYFDVTLKKPIWWTGSAWVDATGANV